MALMEAMFAIGITAILIAAICSIALFSGRSFAALFNYVDLDDSNRIAMDYLTRDVRQCNRFLAYATNTVIMEDFDGSFLYYYYSPSSRTLTRYKNGASKVLLRECDRLNFSFGQRNSVEGSYDVYPAASADTAKLVNVSWSCSRSLFGNKENTESVQTARIVIRKQGT